MYHIGMIGREKEAQELEELYSGGRAEFVAVSGRMGVSKTYLIDQVFDGRITFRHTGLSPIEGKEAGEGLLKAQLRAFYESMLRQGFVIDHCPADWQEAFFMLSMVLQDIDDGSRQLVFLDELPWMDTPRSFFITALEGFWNGWGCHRPGFMLIVCGSANSWILDNLINNHGGLYGRVTYQIRLSPFSLGECEEFFESIGLAMTRYDIVQSYMIVGGIPYYIGYMIDLLISRMDNVVNMCEIKFYNDLFAVDGSYYRILMHRQNLLVPHLKRGTGIHNTLITTYGLVKNKYSGIFSNVVTLDDLFSN